MLMSNSNERFDAIHDGDVEFFLKHVAPGFTYVFCECCELNRAPGTDNDTVTMRCQVARRCLTDAAARAGNQYYLARGPGKRCHSSFLFHVREFAL
jgi:hypothetical protein